MGLILRLFAKFICCSNRRDQQVDCIACSELCETFTVMALKLINSRQLWVGLDALVLEDVKRMLIKAHYGHHHVIIDRGVRVRMA